MGRELEAEVAFSQYWNIERRKENDKRRNKANVNTENRKQRIEKANRKWREGVFDYEKPQNKSWEL